uniref:tRNA wybutosine-synthesizing protein 3 homolog n=1 Tax=Strigamia maritima TaxID=126957 RepID=T1JA02_STRMM
MTVNESRQSIVIHSTPNLYPHGTMATVKNQFDLAKQQRLAGVDLSKKGSIDEPIRDLVEYINGCNDFVTSSSCSGRVVVYCQVTEGKIIKSGCKWILVSHEKVDGDALFAVLDPKKGDLVLKFEPFILHVQCRHLQHAQFMHKIAINSGFRNSGITMGKAGKITLAVRSSLSLEVPLSFDEKLLVDKEVMSLAETGKRKADKKSFFVGDDVLSRWSDGLSYLGIVIKVDAENAKCLVRFEDNSEYWAMFKDLQKGAGEDSEIVCSLCENGESDPPNEIVICDNCGFGFHQLCHNPEIPNEVLQPDYPWLCRQCAIGKNTKNGTYLNKSSIGLAVQNFKCFPYDIKSLSWDSHHKTNAQHCYCYCGGPGEWYMKMLHCARCKQWFHEACIQKLQRPMLFGDRFYIFVCYVCNNGNEFIHRLEMKWPDLAHLVIYNLTVTHHKKYFDFETAIMQFVEQCWNLLQLSPDSDLGKSTNEDRKTNLLTALQNNKTRFKCGKEIKKKTTIWGLRVRIPPPAPKIELPLNVTITSDVIKHFAVRRKKCAKRQNITNNMTVLKPTKPKNGLRLFPVQQTTTTTPTPRPRGRPPKPKPKPKPIVNGCVRMRRREDDLLLEDVSNSNIKKIADFETSESFTSVRVKRKYKKRNTKCENKNGTKKNQIKPNRMCCKTKYKNYAPIDRSMRCQVVDGFENSSDDDDTTSHGTLDSIIPPPLNFEGHNHPFRNLDLFPFSLSRPVKRKLGEHVKKNGQIKQRRGRPPRVDNLLLPNGYSSRFVSSEHVSETSMDTGSDFDICGNEIVSMDSMQTAKISFCDLKSSVNTYFGAANRIASGEQFSVLARRVSPEGKAQYLIEWEGLTA